VFSHVGFFFVINGSTQHGGTLMLVLSRRIDESIVIAGDIRVTVISVQADKVRLGIAAPLSVTVDREEVAARRRAGADSSEGGAVTIDATHH
jgi:carbon storage regulator